MPVLTNALNAAYQFRPLRTHHVVLKAKGSAA
jgi:hypothetical protein